MAKEVMPTQPLASAYLIGLLSLIDAMVDGDIQELMDKLPLHQKIKNAIINRQGELAKFLQLCELFEKADWPNIEMFCQQIALESERSGLLFREALDWADLRMSAI
jgi:EAL and modified HD-GYP domain-containing signal transduction protein